MQNRENGKIIGKNYKTLDFYRQYMYNDIPVANTLSITNEKLEEIK